MPSASFSFETEMDDPEGGAKVGYLREVSFRKEAISIGEALVKSTTDQPRKRACHSQADSSLLSLGGRPASSRDNARALAASFIPPRHASSVFQSRSSTFLMGYPLGSRSFSAATIWKSTMGRGGDIATTAESAYTILGERTNAGRTQLVTESLVRSARLDDKVQHREQVHQFCRPIVVWVHRAQTGATGRTGSIGYVAVSSAPNSAARDRRVPARRCAISPNGVVPLGSISKTQHQA